MKPVFIINPRSAAGATLGRLDALKAHAGSVFNAPEYLITERPGHASDLAAEHGGADLLVAVGGDGTANEVVNGLARLALQDRPVFAVLPAGTGSDLVKTLGTPSDLGEALRFLASCEPKPTDWMRLRIGDVERISINVAGFGMSGMVVQRANKGSKKLGGTVTFALATLRTLASWTPPLVEARWSGPEGDGEWQGRLASVFLANGQFCGGGMWVGRGGSMGDGLMEMTILPDLPIRTMVKGLPRLYNGRIAEVEGVVRAAVSHFEAIAVSDDVVLIDADGEQPGALPATVDLVPSAVRVVRT